MKKTSNSKKGTMPGGAPKGMNPLAYFNSLKGKTKTEPKQTLRKAQDGGIASPPGVPGYPTDTQFVKDPNASTYKDYLDFYGGPAEPGRQKQEPTWKSEKEYNDSKNLRLNKVNQELKANSYWPYDAQNHPTDWSPKSNLKKGGLVKSKKK
jgi:hypothetical protein